jgi:hypothetical protein
VSLTWKGVGEVSGVVGWVVGPAPGGSQPWSSRGGRLLGLTQVCVSSMNFARAAPPARAEYDVGWGIENPG